MPRRLAQQTNVVRTQFTLNEVAICFASYRFALIILKSLCLLPSKVHVRFQEQRTLFGPCFASCFKKMRNSIMKEATQVKFFFFSSVPCACVHLLPWNPVEVHKCPAVSSFSTESFLSNFLKVSNVFLKSVNRFKKLIWFFKWKTLWACSYFNNVRLTVLLTRLSGTLSNGLNAGKSEIFTISNQISSFSSRYI